MSTENWRVYTVINDDGVQVTKNKTAQTKNSALLISKPIFRHEPFSHTHTQSSKLIHYHPPNTIFQSLSRPYK